MIKIPSYIPITSDENKGNASQFFSSFFYYRNTRFVKVGKNALGQLCLKRVEATNKNVAHKGLKIALLFTGVVPLFAALWLACRSLHVKCAAKKWTFDPPNLPPVPPPPGGTSPTPPGTPPPPGAPPPPPGKAHKLPLAAQKGLLNNSGAICWFNSEMQVIAHNKSLRALFSPKKNPIKQRATETEDDFKLRQQIQTKGHALIRAILRGNNGADIDNSHELGELLQKAGLIGKYPPNLYKPHVLQELPYKIAPYLKQNSGNCMTKYNAVPSKPSFSRYSPPPQMAVIETYNPPREIPITITNNGVSEPAAYVLQSIVEKGGHFTTVVFEEDGSAVRFDDGHVTSVKKEDVSTEVPGYFYYALKRYPAPLPLTQHAGIENRRMVCWFNSEVQVIAHIPHLRNLFSHRLNPLKKCTWETDEAFKLRQQIQEKGHAIIEAILSGNNNQPVDVEELGELLVQAKLSNGQRLIGMDVFNGVHPIEELPRKLIPYLLGTQITTTYAGEVSFQDLSPCSKSELDNFSRLYENNFQQNGFNPKHIYVEALGLQLGKLPNELKTMSQYGPGQTYILHCAVGGPGHAIAYIRDKDGSFVKFDDAKVEATDIKEFTTSDPWKYYYILKE